MLSGRPLDALFYGVVYSGVADDSEGVEPDTLTLRIAYDVMPNMMIGGLAINGTCSISAANCSVERDYTRYAIDTEVWFDNLVITSVYMQAKDDNATATTEEKNNAFYVQGLYALQSGGRTRWAPLVRFDAYEKSNGTEDIKEITLGLNYYFAENLRGMLEYWDRNGEGTTTDDNRLTVQVFAAF